MAFENEPKATDSYGELGAGLEPSPTKAAIGLAIMIVLGVVLYQVSKTNDAQTSFGNALSDAGCRKQQSVTVSRTRCSSATCRKRGALRCIRDTAWLVLPLPAILVEDKFRHFPFVANRQQAE